MKYLKVFAILSLIMSCKGQANSDLILGNWTKKEIPNSNKYKITFLENNLAVFKERDKGSTTYDTLNYNFSADNSRLITTEKSGKVFNLEIFKLTKNELILVRKQDTLRLFKE